MPPTSVNADSPPAVPPHDRSEVLVFTNGCFDLFHCGHVDFLRRCRERGTRLIVGINTDHSVRCLKGAKRPINPLHARTRVVAACRYVDEVLAFDQATPCELIRTLQPDIIIKGPGYSEANMPEAEVVKQYGGQVIILNGPDISTSRMIDRILAAHS